MSELSEVHKKTIDALVKKKRKYSPTVRFDGFLKVKGKKYGSMTSKEKYLRKKYGITEQRLEAMIALQGGRCAICEVVPEKGLVVDHDHATGKVRQLLCSRCNVFLGFADDDINKLYKAMLYIRKHRMEVT